MQHRKNFNITGWMSVLSAALFFFYWFIQLSLSNTLVNYYTEKYQLIQYGLFTSMYLIGNVLMFIPAGVILDRYSPRKVIGTAITVMLFGVLGMMLTKFLIIAYVCMLFIGFSGAFSLLGCVKVAANWFHEGSVGFPISIAITVAFLGSYLGNAVGQECLAYFQSGTVVQFIDIILGLIIFIVIILFLKTPKDNRQIYSNQSIKKALEQLLNVMSKKQNWYAGLYISLMNFPVMILEFSFGQTFLDHVFSITMEQAANITGIISVGFMVGGPVWNKVSDKSGLRRPFILIGGFLSLGITLLLLIHSFSEIELIIIFFFIGVLTSAQTLGYPVITESNNPEITASATSLASLLIMGGGAIAQIIFGYIQLGLGYQLAYFIIPFCILIAITLGFLLKETNKNY